MYVILFAAMVTMPLSPKSGCLRQTHLISETPCDNPTCLGESFLISLSYKPLSTQTLCRWCCYESWPAQLQSLSSQGLLVNDLHAISSEGGILSCRGTAMNLVDLCLHLTEYWKLIRLKTSKQNAVMEGSKSIISLFYSGDLAVRGLVSNTGHVRPSLFQEGRWLCRAEAEGRLGKKYRERRSPYVGY